MNRPASVRSTTDVELLVERERSLRIAADAAGNSAITLSGSRSRTNLLTRSLEELAWIDAPSPPEPPLLTRTAQVSAPGSSVAPIRATTTFRRSTSPTAPPCPIRRG